MEEKYKDPVFLVKRELILGGESMKEVMHRLGCDDPSKITFCYYPVGVYAELLE